MNEVDRSHEQKQVLPAEHINYRVLYFSVSDILLSLQHSCIEIKIKSITSVRHTCSELLRLCTGKKMACAIRWEVPTICIVPHSGKIQ